MLKKWRKYLGGPDPDYPRPELEPGEWIILEGRTFFQLWRAAGPIILTNRRFIWYDDSWDPNWPFKRISGQLRVSEIMAVDKGGVIDFIARTTRLRLRLRNGQRKSFFAPEGLDEWITAIKTAIAMYGTEAAR